MWLWQVQAQSEFSEDELLSVVIMKVIALLYNLMIVILWFIRISYFSPLGIFLLSVIPISFFLFDQNGQKVVCSSQTGIILLYSWGCFKDCRYVNLTMYSNSRWTSKSLDMVFSHDRRTFNFVFPLFTLTDFLMLIFWIPVIVLLISPQILLMLCWRWVGHISVLSSIGI